MATEATKDALKELRQRLSYAPRLVWDAISEDEKKAAEELCQTYKRFLGEAKTERLATRRILQIAEAAGFERYRPGGHQKKYYLSLNQKCTALVIRGTRTPLEGLRIIGSHVDAPRFDLKQNPLYEEAEVGFFKTHYYGGIKKYQWFARPLALYGTLVRGNGEAIDLAIGDSEDDPVFTIADLLPHLARKQRETKVVDAFEAEKMNIVAGSLPVPGSDKDSKERVKLNLLRLLNEKYGIVEEDFISAELEIVPAGQAKDVGLDRSLVGAYGQDDRICAFSSLKALLDAKDPPYPCIAIFFDKEEIGSDGATGAKSRFIEVVVADLLRDEGIEPNTANILRALTSTKALSADVNGALDPDYQEVHEKRNAARLGYGVCLTKFTGSGGKYGANDANAEFVGWLRNLFNKRSVVWQTGELGKVDEGGGGTIAKHLAAHGMDVIDCGPAILSMHAPFELASKVDVFMTYRAYNAFFTEP